MTEMCAQATAPLHCLFEDPHLLVLDKPAGLLCVPGRGPDKCTGWTWRPPASC